MKVFRTVARYELMRIFTFFVLLVFFTPLYGSAAEIDDRISQCAKIEDHVVRLKCFDELSGRKAFPAEAAGVDATASDAPKKLSPMETAKLSVMTRHWDLDPNNREHSFTLKPYRLNYLLPVAYNSSPNQDTDLDNDPNSKAQHNEAKFQISFKAKVWEDVLQEQLQWVYDRNVGVKGIDIWVAYTQLSFWQLYNSAFSAPFRDTNYEPEVFINFRTDYELFGVKGRFVNVGFNHQSNGRSRPLSRGWNRLVANVGFEKDNFGLLLKTWYRIPADEAKDDNPDITRYMGYGELWGTLYWKKQRIAVMLRNNLRKDNLGAVQLDWSIPLSVIHERLSDKFGFYIQYFNGYGEGLMDYNKSINRISVGFMIAEWN